MLSQQPATSHVNGFIVLGYAVTPLHPGVGRAPGAVDLPVQRDPMGYPMVFASSVKGALKAECGRQSDASGGCFDQNGRIKCDDPNCTLCCCLFGHEPGGKPSTGLLSVLDFIPIAFPVPSLDLGYVYVTTPYIARRALAILDAIALPPELKNLKEFLRHVAGLGLSIGDSGYGCTPANKIYIALEEIEVNKLGDVCSKLKVLQDLGGLAEDIASRLIVVSDDKGPLYVEKGLVRVTRIRLNISTKTVAEGALWTEEYIPAGTLFLGGFIATLPKKNEYCCKALQRGGNCEEYLVKESDLKEILQKFNSLMKTTNNTTYMIVGGKETIGRGLVKLRIHMA